MQTISIPMIQLPFKTYTFCCVHVVVKQSNNSNLNIFGFSETRYCQYKVRVSEVIIVVKNIIEFRDK